MTRTLLKAKYIINFVAFGWATEELNKIPWLKSWQLDCWKLNLKACTTSYFIYLYSYWSACGKLDKVSQMVKTGWPIGNNSTGHSLFGGAFLLNFWWLGQQFWHPWSFNKFWRASGDCTLIFPSWRWQQTLNVIALYSKLINYFRWLHDLDWTLLSIRYWN